MAQIADDEDSDAGLDDVQPDDHLIVTCESRTFAARISNIAETCHALHVSFR